MKISAKAVSLIYKNRLFGRENQTDSGLLKLATERIL